MKKILVLQGPNLNMLGVRESSFYGTSSLETLTAQLITKAQAHNVVLTSFQSNSEGELIHAIHQAYANKIHYIIINPAAYTHTSVALRDALLAVAIPFIEVHITNIYARESFRHYSYLSDIAQGVICGFGIKGYYYALQIILDEFIQLRE